MSDLIPPRRSEVITRGGEMTVRFAEYLEDLASMTNSNDSQSQEVFALAGAVNRLQSLLSEFQRRVDDLEQSGVDLTAVIGRLGSLGNRIDDNEQTVPGIGIMQRQITDLQNRMNDLEQVV